MSDKKVRILGIAPYEGMRSIMLKAAEARNDIDLTVYVGDLQEGAEIAKRSFHDNYDIIISRGGTAELIGQITHSCGGDSPVCLRYSPCHQNGGKFCLPLCHRRLSRHYQQRQTALRSAPV